MTYMKNMPLLEEEKSTISFKGAVETVSILFTLPVCLYFVARFCMYYLTPMAFMPSSDWALALFYIWVSILGAVCVILPVLLTKKLLSRVHLPKRDALATSSTAGILAFALGGATGFLAQYATLLARV